MTESLPGATSMRPALVRLVDAITEAVRERSSELALYFGIALIVGTALVVLRVMR